MIGYCRVKWLIKLLPKEEIVGDSLTSSDYITLKIDDTITSWFLKLNESSTRFKFSIIKSKFNNDKATNYSVSLYYIALNKIYELKDIHVSNEDDHIMWKIKKDLLVDEFEDKNEIFFHIVFNVQELKIHPEIDRPSLATLSERILIDTVTTENVLDMLNYAVIYNSKELESKCLSTVMLVYENLKGREQWQNLRPTVMAKIMDTFNGAIHVICQHTKSPYIEAEYDSNEEIFDSDKEEEFNELVFNLGFNSDFSEGDNSDMEAF